MQMFSMNQVEVVSQAMKDQLEVEQAKLIEAARTLDWELLHEQEKRIKGMTDIIASLENKYYMMSLPTRKES